MYDSYGAFLWAIANSAVQCVAHPTDFTQYLVYGVPIPYSRL